MFLRAPVERNGFVEMCQKVPDSGRGGAAAAFGRGYDRSGRRVRRAVLHVGDHSSVAALVFGGPDQLPRPVCDAGGLGR
jgi:hypothetical protein